MLRLSQIYVVQFEFDEKYVFVQVACTVMGNTMLYILRYTRHVSNSNSFSFWVSNSYASPFLDKEVFTMLLKVIKHFLSSTWHWPCSSLSALTMPTTTRTRKCVSTRPLLGNSPAAGAEVTQYQCHEERIASSSPLN